MRKLAALLAAILCFTTAAWAKDITVKDFSPQGETDADRPRITVVFSDAVVEKSKVNKQLTGASVPLKFRPALPGTARWISQNKLVFTPSRDIQPATRYIADFGPGGLKTAAGSLVAGPQTFEFHGPVMRFMNAGINGVSPNRNLVLNLEFNAPVSPVRLRGFLSIYNDGGGLVDYDIRGAAPSKNVIVQTAPVTSKSIKVIVAGGLLPDTGDLPQETNYEVDLNLEMKTAILNSNAYMRDSGNGYISFTVSDSNVDIKKARNYIEISPRMPFTLGAEYRGFTIEGKFKPRSRVTVTIRKGFTAGSADPMEEDYKKSFIFPDMSSNIRFPSEGMFLTPAETPRVAIETTNVNTLRLSAWKLYNNNIPIATLGVNEWDSNFTNYAKALGSKKYQVGGMTNEKVRRAVDLSTLGCEGEGIYLIKASNADPDTWDSASMLLCVTDTALSARMYKNGLHVWATSISGAKPVEGAEVKVYSASNQLLLTGSTNADGVVEFSVPEGWNDDLRPNLITAEKEGLITFVKMGINQLTGRDIDVSGAPWSDAYDAMWVLPRALWQPGETLEAEALVRSTTLELPGEFPLTWSLSARGIDLASGTLKLDPDGMGSISVPIPDTVESGTYSLKLMVPGKRTALAERTVQIEEFRPPEVETKIEAPEALYPGEDGSFKISARYLFGGSGAGLNWEMTYATVPEAYVSKNNPGYVFGSEMAKDAGRTSGTIDEGTFGSDGTSEVSWAPDSDLKAPSIIRARIRLNVMEASGRWTGSTVSVPIYPTKALIGVLRPTTDIQPGSSAEIGLVAVNPDDQPVDLGDVTVEVCKVTSRYVMVSDENGSRMTWQEEFSEPVRSKVKLNGKGKFIFTPEDEGYYLITFSHEDGRASLRLSVWRDYSGSASMGASMPDRVELRSDKDSYAAGTTAKIRVKAPFAGHAVVTAGSDKPMMIKAFDMTGTEAEVEIPVSEAITPNGWVVVQVTRPEGMETRPPYRALGAMPLKLDLSSHKLNVQVSVPEKAEPGMLTAKINLTDASGAPVNGKVSLALVDRGILLLSGEDNQNPFDYFTRRRGLDGRLCDIYDSLLPIEARGTALLHPAGGDADEMGRMKLMANADMMSPVRASDYKPTSIWLPSVNVENGAAEVTVQVPEFTGALRVEAVAAAGSSVGRGISETKIARPVVISLTLPRFAAPGDEIQPAVNITSDQDGSASVTVSMTEGLASLSQNGTETMKDVKLTADKRVDLSGSLPRVMALDGIEHGTLSADVKLNDTSYTSETGLAIRPGWPLTSLTGGASVTEGTNEFTIPDDWYPGTGAITVSVSGAPVVDAAALLDTVNSWGWGLDQLVSRGWIVLNLPGLLSDADQDLVEPGENRIALNTILAGISSYQLYDGSWSRWRSGGSNPWASVAALHFLTAVKAAGVLNPAGLENGYQWLRRYMAEPLPSEKAHEALSARAYGCYVLALAGEAPLGWMNWLEERVSSMNGSGRSLLAAAYAVAGSRKKAQSLAGSESGSASGALEFPEAGFRMLALDAIEPGGAPSRNLAARIAEQLSKKVEFRYVDDAASMIMALSVFSSHVTPGAATARLLDSEGNEVLAYEGQPVQWKAVRGGKMTLQVTGSGSLWYSWTASGVPASPVKEYTNGLKVTRQFLDAKTGKPVNLKNVKFGELLSMKISMNVTSAVSALRLSALFPAGIEAVSAGEAVESSGFTVRSDLRADRLLLNLFGSGKTFVWKMPCRATYRGVFAVPPISVEALGNKGVGCLSGAAQMTVE